MYSMAQENIDASKIYLEQHIVPKPRKKAPHLITASWRSSTAHAPEDVQLS